MRSVEYSQVCGTDAAVMQRAGDQYTGCARVARGKQVVKVAGAASKEQTRVAAPFPGELLQQGKIRTGIGTDTSQVHQDQVARMAQPVGGKAGRITQTGCIQVDRQQAVRRCWCLVLPALAADNRSKPGSLARRLYGRRMIEAAVDPHRKGRKTLRDGREQWPVVTVPEDGVEIGKIQCRTTEPVVQSSNQPHRVAITAQCAVDRAIAAASTLPREHRTVFE